MAGDIRLQAHQRLGHEKILAHVIDDGNLAELALVENVQRTDLSPIDLANKVTELIDTHESLTTLPGFLARAELM